MKKIQLIIICLLFTLSKANAQESQFKFHLAFEDATGAKDTVWLIWDSSATLGYDPMFDETPQSLPTDTFQVYIKYSASDSGKVRAYPLNVSGIGFEIYAKHYVYPINMYWDSSLIFNNNLPFTINTATLDNEWFFFYNDGTLDHAYNMLTADSSYVQLPFFAWGSQDHFPISFSFGYDPFLNTHINKDQHELHNIIIYPNPVFDDLMIEIDNVTDYSVRVLNTTGNVIMQENCYTKSLKLDIGLLPKGIYFIEVFNDDFSYKEKIIKY